MAKDIPWGHLKDRLQGELYSDHLHRMMYATDASIYRKLPLAVVTPKGEQDLVELVIFAVKYRIPLIPRTAGTSLAGQVVGEGVVVDVSRHMTSVLEYNVEEKWVKVQPGVIRDELNDLLKPLGLFFGPNTSTSNRCMIGGMVGNNSCGSTSIKYGTTRDHVLSIDVVLSDGSTATIDRTGIYPRSGDDVFVQDIYRKMKTLVRDPENAGIIKSNYPKPDVTRRNTGYALDLLVETESCDLTKILCGSEGTLALFSSIKLSLEPLPPGKVALLTPHFDSLDDSLKAVQVAMKYDIYSCELMDDVILSCTRGLPKFERIRSFVEGSPKSILMIECRANDTDDALRQARLISDEMRQAGLGYAFPILRDGEADKAWNLRKAGLGLLSNLPGKGKAVACIEDTAVAVKDLPSYIAEFEQIMSDFGQRSVYYAHAGAGELHLRPILDLKTDVGKKQLADISLASAKLVAKYNGSLSGEHGDGVVRSGYIKEVLGSDVVDILREVKRIWDPGNNFNPGKILDAWPIDQHLRYENEDRSDIVSETGFDYGEGGMLEMAERCNGSGDCRRTEKSGMVMCPTYMATRDEVHSTRARANVLRELLIHPPDKDVMQSTELEEVMELCISCKGCTSECPSNVDVATLKAEYLFQKYKNQKRPLRDRLFARAYLADPMVSSFGTLGGMVNKFKPFKKLVSGLTGVDSRRAIPVANGNFFKWLRSDQSSPPEEDSLGTVHLYIDEFCAYQDVQVAKAAYKLLTGLGYSVHCHKGISGRTFISKGFLKEAAELARDQVDHFFGIAKADEPLIGLEPSAILTFRDEMPRLVRGEAKERALVLSSNVFTLEEFMSREINLGKIHSKQFDTYKRHILFHGHCHQKALSEETAAIEVLSAPVGNVVERIPSGCCGMAGSFGYEKEHYDISMKIGEMVLFPAVRRSKDDSWIVASGTSCRHQIQDGTGRKAVHFSEMMLECLK